MNGPHISRNEGLAPMSAEEFAAARAQFGLGRREFGRLLGQSGGSHSVWMVVKRYELGPDQPGGRAVPPGVERLVRMLVWFHNDHGYLPDLAAGARVPMLMPAGGDDER